MIMKEILETGAVTIKCWTDGVPQDEAERKQRVNVARHPNDWPHVAQVKLPFDIDAIVGPRSYPSPTSRARGAITRG